MEKRCELTNKDISICGILTLEWHYIVNAIFMDDTLEIPRPRAENIQEGDDHSSGDEDGGLDWTKLP